jgi:hypothetical protein
MKCIYFLIVAVFVDLFSAQAQTIPAVTGAADSSKYTSENCINAFKMEKVEKTRAGYQYWFADSTFADGKTLKMSVVGPHMATPAPHKHV